MHEANNQLTTQLIRNNIHQFVKAREKAYHALISQGHEVPDYTHKCKAINMLFTQLEASTHWSLMANVNWIHAMRHLLTSLLPRENHPEQRMRTYRQRMINMLNFCDELYLQQQQLSIPITYEKTSAYLRRTA